MTVKKSQRWDYIFYSNCDIDSEAWLRSHVVDVLTEVEKWDVRARFLTVIKNDNLIDIRAYYKPKESPPDQKPFEQSVFCTRCKKEVCHDLNTCIVTEVMDS